ncbi:RnfABCDGE type electron transport complex subunit D [Paenibacillus kobensis]|uniref:RnfABCDGE type electron transport complex subunit D n=1 Tax=Paenibacillus kobensis TaxID=59841 RepID=UPI001580BB45|nr:RnfABCDGE type electron transport complex subunit D [Paenibacillus kobensis]
MMGIKVDPRYFVLLFLLSFVIAGQLFLGFFQKWDSMAVSVSVAVMAELLLTRLIRRQWIMPTSALITGLGISLLLSSHLLWPYACASLLSIIIKHAVRMRGKHIFNPNNVAMCFMLWFLPQYAVSTPKQWTNGYEVMVFILLLGAIAAYSAGRLDTVISFILGFAFFACIRYYFFDEPLFYAFGPMLGASFQLFSFFMITDPQTTPPTRVARIMLAVCISGVDTVLRLQEVTNSTFYSAFLVTLFIGLPYRIYYYRKSQERVVG